MENGRKNEHWLKAPLLWNLPDIRQIGKYPGGAQMLTQYDEWLFATDTPQPLFYTFDGLLTSR